MTQILLIEDDVQFGTLLQISLEDAGYRVFYAEGYDRAVEILSHHRLDLIISDVFLHSDKPMSPKSSLSIMQLADRLVSPSGDIVPVIAISGGFLGRELADEVTGAARDLGAAASLAKPFAPDALLELVDDLLQATQDSRERRLS